MALSAALHHSRGVGRELHEATRGPKTDRDVEEEVHEANDALEGQKRPPPGERPAPLPEVAGPQAAVTVGYVAAGVPLPLLADSSAEAIDGSTLSFFQQRALEVKRKEKEEAVEAAELVELEEKLAAAEGWSLEVLRRDRGEGTRVTHQTWSTLCRVDQHAVLWFLAKDAVGKRTTMWTRWRRAGLVFYSSS